MDQHLDSTQSELENPPITFKDIIRKIIRARLWIISSSLIVLLGTIYVTFSTPPIYQASVSIMIEKTSRAQTIFNFGENDNFTI